ncbi:Trp biosynthesis-associated membrane protein [Microlunatus parietis]|uniref:Putative membrane protein (TIGR02234 family) n=1 Tax=Microlunatus parietis TaxID=682979 RepID=A0A7Y9I2Y3_9ACTN|nr:Trp biosynthesis-associated membrane protein [Microlunatus parietis]NYE69218.1 putative membrane protein (TIGR02234 family) [Microlunatus parietis]
MVESDTKITKAAGLSPGRARFLALAGVALAGLLALIISGQPWWRAQGSDAGVVFTGSDATAGLSQALGAVALAGFLLALTLRGRGRQVLAVLLGLVGVAVIVVGGFRFQPDTRAVRAKLQQVSLSQEFALTGTPWPIGYVIAGVLLLGAAILIMITAPSWPTRADRFRRGRSGAATADAEPIDLWKAMDAGADPTDEGADPDRSRTDN